jgi:hypothetical protein
MSDRIEQEFELLLTAYPNAKLEGRWVFVPDYPLPSGWSRSLVDTCFQIRDPYPQTSPYGIHVRDGLRFEGNKPQKYTEPSNQNPPFDGRWAIFSWEATAWQPGADPASGHNLLTWVAGFRARFSEGV